MQSENCSEQVASEWAIDAGHKLSLQLERTWNPEQTVNNIDVINIFVLIENKCNNRKSWQWLERHAGGGRETMIQFVVA